jgi:hypothetical protein
MNKAHRLLLINTREQELIFRVIWCGKRYPLIKLPPPPPSTWQSVLTRHDLFALHVLPAAWIM